MSDTAATIVTMKLEDVLGALNPARA